MNRVQTSHLNTGKRDKNSFGAVPLDDTQGLQNHGYDSAFQSLVIACVSLKQRMFVTLPPTTATVNPDSPLTPTTRHKARTTCPPTPPVAASPPGGSQLHALHRITQPVALIIVCICHAVSPVVLVGPTMPGKF
ncbi:hypothetical protein BC936DRAFT_142544 [Jimgerdemannia flammicorona]|uniref:Uncharacterized protein n=2 Tax=Jimgerdemannia flammicorona TaxID=994334 RepID=A0A433DF34_9FUNG|nr:hypothetical protein BC936DRAFT_142544 [Jimgerdemannia flammicorona]RUS30667.1 hypothetical protein BC938DRAFT_479101 [Jimgerdemannia flammicorona]